MKGHYTCRHGAQGPCAACQTEPGGVFYGAYFLAAGGVTHVDRERLAAAADRLVVTGDREAVWRAAVALQLVLDTL